MKPIELLTELILDGTKPNMLVYDAFLGSGSTLIACEQTARVCCGIELSPAYVDVIVTRYVQHVKKSGIILNGKKTKWKEV
jgi:DNA modification methylase